MSKLLLGLAELMAIETTLGLEVVNSNPAEPATGMISDGPPFRELCLKVGSAVCEAAKTQAEVVVVFDADELWLLRETLDIFATSGPNQEFGLHLKCKVYGALLEMTNAVDAAEADAPQNYAEPAYDLGSITGFLAGLSDADTHSA